jgi:undecaprenyl-phosphate 4-deoxy-4-formamido-L-arabinose transferase
LSIVIPVYRSEGYLARTVGDLLAALGQARELEIVLVNDGSPDGVQSVMDALCSGDQRVKQVTLARNVGQHRATLRGFLHTTGDVVVTVDDDGQNPPSAVEAVVAALTDDLDVVYGKFHQVEQSGARRLASRINRRLSRLTLQNIRDLSITNVRAIRGDLARWVAAADSSFPYIDALLFRATNRMGEVPVEHHPRGAGGSTYSLSKLLDLWISHMTSLTVLPLRLAVLGSFTVSILGFLAGVVQLVRVLVEAKAPAGWLSLFCAVTFLFSILFAFLGILSAYLGRMYVAMNDRGLVWERPSARVAKAPSDG